MEQRKCIFSLVAFHSWCLSCMMRVVVQLSTFIFISKNNVDQFCLFRADIWARIYMLKMTFIACFCTFSSLWGWKSLQKSIYTSLPTNTSVKRKGTEDLHCWIFHSRRGFGDLIVCFCLPSGRKSHSQPGHQARQQGDWSQGKLLPTLNTWQSLQSICLDLSWSCLYWRLV